MNDELDLLSTISKKLNILIYLEMATDDRKVKVSEGVAILSRFGLANSDIAEILGTTKRTIEVTKSRLSKEKTTAEESPTVPMGDRA